MVRATQRHLPLGPRPVDAPCGAERLLFLLRRRGMTTIGDEYHRGDNGSHQARNRLRRLLGGLVDRFVAVSDELRL